MSHSTVEDLLSRLNSTDAQEAWEEFLNDYSTLIYQVIRHFEDDLDNASDCFQFVCERLIENGAKRLRRFKSTGTAKFTTWLRAVVRNLCIDWHRKHFGRQRTFRSVSRLSTFDQEVFRLVYGRGIPLAETLTILDSGFQNVTEARLVQSKERIETVLTPKQRWLLSQRAAQGIANEGDSNEQIENLFLNLPDPQPDPETQAALNERKKKLERALAGLSDQDRLLIRMRFEQELTLDQAAKLLDLGNAQRADRRLKDILVRLRNSMS